MRKSKRLFAIALFVLAHSALALQTTIIETNTVGKIDVVTRWTYNLDIGSNPRTATLLRVEDAVGSITIQNLISASGTLYTVTNIACGALADNPALLACTVPNTILSIGSYAFSNCTALAEVTLEYGVRQIGERAFVNTIVREINLPDSVMELGGNIAAGTLFTSTINIGDSSHFVYSEDGVLYNRDMTKLYACPTRAEETINIPSSVTDIGKDAFFGCFRLAYLNIPAAVSTIGSGAFNVGGIWPGLPAPESSPKLKYVYYNGSAPDAEDDIYEGTPESLISYVNADAAGFPAGTWKNRQVCIIAMPGATNQVYDDGTVKWKYNVSNGKAVITGAEGDTAGKIVTIPGALNGFATSELASDALDALTGVKGYESTSDLFIARNGCLYTADGKTLIRVPNGLTLPYNATTDESTERVTVTTIPGLLESGNPGNDGTSVTTNKVIISSSTKTVANGGDISFNTILAGVTDIVDHAFYGCNTSLTDEHDDSYTPLGGETGFIGASGNPYVETVTLESHTITTYKTVVKLPATITSISGNAFEGSAVEVSRSGGNQSATEVTFSIPDVNAGSSAELEANTSYIGWIENGGRTTGTLSIKTGKKANGVFKISGTALRIGSKKKTIKSKAELDALGDVKLVKDISKSKSEKSAFNAFKGKCWTIAYETVGSEAGIGGYTTLSVSVAQNGKVKVKGFAPDGTKLSGSAQMVKDGDQYKIPLAIQSHTGKKGGIALCLAVGEAGSISADASAESKVVVSGNVVTLQLALVDANVLGGTPGSYLLVGDEAKKSGFELDSTLKGWKPRYTKSTGEIKGSVSFYHNSDGRRVKATVNGITVDGIGYCSATIKKVGSWPALIVPSVK